MVANRCIEAHRYKTGQASTRQKVNYVSMPEIMQKLEQLTQGGQFRTDFTAHQRWLLVGCCAMLVPKQNDLGSCRLWQQAPKWAKAAGSTFEERAAAGGKQPHACNQPCIQQAGGCMPKLKGIRASRGAAR